MSQVTKTALKELQRLDGDIREAEKRADAVGPQLEDVEGPALQLDTEASATRARFQEMKLDERRHELVADELGGFRLADIDVVTTLGLRGRRKDRLG